MPVIGYLGAGMPETYAPLVTAIDHGLSQHPYARARARGSGTSDEGIAAGACASSSFIPAPTVTLGMSRRAIQQMLIPGQSRCAVRECQVNAEGVAADDLDARAGEIQFGGSLWPLPFLRLGSMIG